MVLAAGGTGGHLTPAAALADVLAARGWDPVLMTDARAERLADEMFAAHARIVLPAQGVAGRSAVRAAHGVATLLAGAWRARGAMAARLPAAVIGFGSYPSVGPVLATRLLRRRPAVLLHEQNAILGGANRTLARFAHAIALSHAETARLPTRVRTIVTGNPVRPAIAARAASPYAPPEDAVRLLVLGGSLGARILSDVVPDAIARLPDAIRARVRITQQCRTEDLARVRDAYAASGIAANLAAYFDDIAARLADAHLVVARSGASTVAELGVIGRPAILIPLPGAVDADQMLNARAFEAAGAGWVVPQPILTAAGLAVLLTSLIDDPAALAAAAAKAVAVGRVDAAERLADLVERTIAERRA